MFFSISLCTPSFFIRSDALARYGFTAIAGTFVPILEACPTYGPFA